MKRWIAAAVLCFAGCRETRPRWEVALSLSVESKPDPNTKATGSITLKRAPEPPEKKP